jgi:hypothetical protein
MDSADGNPKPPPIRVTVEPGRARIDGNDVGIETFEINRATFQFTAEILSGGGPVTF